MQGGQAARPASVITSYSIHYTKLYERVLLLQLAGDLAPGGQALHLAAQFAILLMNAAIVAKILEQVGRAADRRGSPLDHGRGGVGDRGAQAREARIVRTPEKSYNFV